MPGIDAAGAAERFLSASFQVKIAEIVIIEKSASSSVASETAFLPDDLVFKPASQRTLCFSVFPQRCRIDLDLPSRAACIGTIAADTLKFFVIMRCCVLHEETS